MGDSYLQSLITQTKNAQGLELAQAINLLQSGSGSNLTKYLNDAQANIKNEITSSKTNMFQKVYGDMQRASSTERAILYYMLRNKDVYNLQDQMYTTVKHQADATILDRDLALRQFQINQWTSDDKLDTLFVYQLSFLVFTVGVILMYLARTGFISAGVATSVFIIMAVIVVLITVNRSQYTKNLRDQREWNRRRFPKYTKIQAPVCPPSNVDVQASIDAAKSWSQGEINTVSSYFNKLGNAVSNGAQSFNQTMNGSQ